MNNTCRLSFPYARDWGYGRDVIDSNGNVGRSYDPHFVQVSSSFAVGREYTQFNPREGWETGSPAYTSEFVFTGYDTVSNPNVIDIVVFYNEGDCMRHDDPFYRGQEGGDYPYVSGGYPTVPEGVTDGYPWRNMTGIQVTGIEGEMAGLCDIELICDEPQAEGVRLGTFNYDVKSESNHQQWISNLISFRTTYAFAHANA